MSFIEVEHLKYRYPHTERLALDDVNFCAEKGDFIGILGANKAGKSTLCQALVGLVPNMFRGAYGGRVQIGDACAADTPVSELCRRVGLVFQNPFNQLSGAADTVFAETAFGLQNFGVPREEIFARVEESLRMMDMWDYRDRNPFDLSGGQVQRVAIAGILAMRPEVLVLDEPTSQLDPQGSEEVFRVVERLAKTGITIFMAEHKLEKLAAYCSRILLLDQGRQLAYDTPQAVFSRDDLDALGVGMPIYTRASRLFSVQKADGMYPVTLSETEALKAAFPKECAVSSGKYNAGALTESGAQAAHSSPSSVETREAVFSLDKLCFSYVKERQVLPSLSLSIYAEPTAIVGQNGAGKTTLVKLLKGLLKPQAGKILFFGADMAGRTVAELSGKIGYVFQNPDDQIFKSRVLDEVMVGPRNIGMTDAQAKEHALAALELLGLSALSDENPYDLELSERKFLAIASVLAMDPQVLILDEPTIAQDAAGKELLGRVIAHLSAQGKTVISVLHDMDFVAEHFSRVIVMAHGKVLADGSPDVVFYQKHALEEARLEQPHVARLCAQLGYTGRYVRVRDLERKGGDVNG